MPLPPETLPPGYTQPSAYQTKVTRSERPWLTLVVQADPCFHQDKRREVEYEFTGRSCYADRSKRGAYA